MPPVVIVEETAETLATVNAAVILSLLHIVDEFVPETLMVPLAVVVRDELGCVASGVLRTG